MSSRADSNSNWRQRQSPATGNSTALTSTSESSRSAPRHGNGGRPTWRKENRSLGVDPPEGGAESTSNTTTHRTQEVDLTKRIYLGNLLYFATEQDVKGFLAGYNYSKITIAIDPFTSRNPSYCFVDFHDTAEAQRAMQELDGKILLNRPVKTRAATASRAQRERRIDSETDAGGRSQIGKQHQAFAYDRWSRKPVEALKHHFPAQGSRLWVGNLPGFDLHPPTVQSNLTDLFEQHGYKVTAISKIIPALEKTEGLNSKSFTHYAFVDFSDPDTAKQAQRAVDGTLPPWGGQNVKVNIAAGGTSWKVHQRQDYLERQAQEGQ